MPDDDPDLLTIGDVACGVGLPASALRHDDECGLLVPARTDASTGYRYYTPALERRTAGARWAGRRSGALPAALAVVAALLAAGALLPLPERAAAPAGAP